jgi:two-component system response regulator HydG
MDTLPNVFWGELEDIHKTVRKIAPTDYTILIQGETGTGKRLVAKIIHMLSSRRDQPFIPIACGSLSNELVDTDSFGYERCMITIGGTLFFDEVCDMSLDVQSRMMRMLELKEFSIVRERKKIKLDVRVIASSKKDLRQAMDAGLFRKDLYYRLNVVTLKLPPLRERREDIIPLAELFAAGRIKKISPRAKRLLKLYDWPGNVRELRISIDRAIVLGDGKVIEPEDLPPSIRKCARIIPAPLESLNRIEQNHIKRVLKYTEWNRREAARILGITIETLRNKINKYTIEKKKGNEKTLRMYRN